MFNLSGSLRFKSNLRDVALPISCFYVCKVLCRLDLAVMIQGNQGSDEFALSICGQRVEIFPA